MNYARSIVLLWISTWILPGCIGGSTPPSRFYLLEAIPAIESAKRSEDSEMLLALAPVRLPKYVDRPQIVTATAMHSYKIDELNRWAEPLDENVTRLLIQNLSRLIPAEVLPTRTSNLARKAKYRLALNILEFHIDPEGSAILNAQWDISREGKRLLHRQSEYRAMASTSDYAVMVAGLNDCLNRLSRDIADRIKSVSGR